MLLRRALITFTLGPLGLYLVWLGSWYFFLPTTLIVLIATAEYGGLMRKLGWQPMPLVLGFSVALQLVAGQWPNLNLEGPAFLLSAFLIFGVALWRYEYRASETAIVDLATMLLGVLLLGWMGGHFFRLREMGGDAWQWTALALLSTWLADTGAYVVGIYLTDRVLGRHPLALRLSPKKTVEGYFGGIVIGTAFTLGLAQWLGLPLAPALVLGLLAGGLSPIGDLGISLLKRAAGVKDSGSLLPGHGGALDRIDSLLWSVTMAYYLLTRL